MTEKNFSANFQMYNMDGLRIQFTVREDDAAEHLRLLSLTLDRLNQEGFSVNEPDSNAKPKVVPIVAFVRSTAQDSKSASFMPCVHLYSPWGNFKAATVYHEKLGDLPFDWQEAQLWDGAAPDRDNASKRGVLTSCEEFSIVLTPRMDYEGNVKRSDGGNIMYAYDRVLNARKEAQHGPQSEQTSNRTTTNGNGPQRPSASVESEIMGIDVADAEPLPFDDNPFNGPVLTTPDQRKEMHALGTLLYEGKWDAKREGFVKHYGLETSNDLNVEQWEKIILYLEEQSQMAINRHHDKFAPGELGNFKTTYHALKELKARLKKQPA